MEIIAHRGVPWEAPENTLESIGLSLDQGADRIEFDVRLTLDGHAVVSHDESTARTSAEALIISETPLARLRELRLPNGEPIPTLAEVCELVRGRGTLNVELKESGEDMVRATLETLQDFGLLESTLISCFDPRPLALTRTLEPRARTGHLFEQHALSDPRLDLSGWPLEPLRRIGANAMVLHHRLATAEIRQQLHDAEFSLYLWMQMKDEGEETTADERAATYRAAASTGPDGIIVGRVAEARQVLGLP